MGALRPGGGTGNDRCTPSSEALQPSQERQPARRLGATRPGAVPKPVGARPADRRQCRTADAGCAAALSREPRTAEGIERIRAARTKHRRYSAASIARRRAARQAIAQFASCFDRPPRPKTNCWRHWLDYDEARASAGPVQRESNPRALDDGSPKIRPRPSRSTAAADRIVRSGCRPTLAPCLA